MDCTQITYEDAIDILSEVQVFTEAGEYALHLATESLAAKSEAEEYRAAKKVIRISDDICICPTCGLGPQRFYISYCGNCGQALDWSEVEK